jgi:hypothetical protein
MAISLEAVAFALTTLLLAVVAIAAIAGADALLASGRLVRCVRCHRYYIATGDDDHRCHRRDIHAAWHALRQRPWHVPGSDHIHHP